MNELRQLGPILASAKGRISAAAILLCALAAVLPSTSLGTGGQSHWYHVTVAHGKNTEGYKWSVGAKGRKGHALDEICATLSMVEPPRSEVPYVEGTDSTDCGSVRRPSESVSSSVSMGEGESLIKVVEVLYRPVVRKVSVFLKSGEEKILRLKRPGIANRAKKGIPMFRFFVLSLEDGACIRRLVSYDGQGTLIKSEKTEACT